MFFGFSPDFVKKKKTKMRQTYILFRPPRDDDSETKESESNSNAVFELGEHIHRGYVDYGTFLLYLF